MTPLRKIVSVVAATTAAVAVLALAGPAADADQAAVPRAELAAVRAATARYHDPAAAEADGYELLDVCFDDPAGGMGYHYLRDVNNTHVDARAPEALVYEPGDHGLQLVAVEYIVPKDLSDDPPTVLGQPLHSNDDLGLWVLHAWIWRPNPSGMFKDFNPTVAPCP